MITNKNTNSISKLKIKDLLIIFNLLLYRVLLDLIYVEYVFPNYGYYHFKLEYNFYFMILSYILTIIMSFYILKLLNRKKMTDIIIALLIIAYFIPYTSIFALCDHNIKYGLFVFAYFLLMLFFNRFINLDKIKNTEMRQFIHPKLFSILTILCALIVIAVSGIYTGFRISFSLSEFYEYRAAAREYSLPEIIKYLFNWAIVGLDIGLAYCIINKKKALTALVVLANLLAFSYNGKKSVMFILIIIVFVSFFFKEKHVKKIPLAFLGMVMIGCIEMAFNHGESFIAKHFIRRMLFIPPFLGTVYYDYFSTHELDFLRASVLRRFGFVSPYGSIPRFIGATYYKNIGIMAMNANTGLCGDAFSNFGFFSLLIAPLAIVITFKVLELCAKNVNPKIKLVVAIWVTYSFVSGAYFTLLLTNGVIFLCILLWALSSEKKWKDFDNEKDNIKNK